MFISWLKRFSPRPQTTPLPEQLLSCLGAFIGLAITAWICRTTLGHSSSPWLIAPMGASAVLLFAVPSSPLAQPWSIVAGNMLSALVGVACAHVIPLPWLAAATASSLAIAAMFAGRCVHPPGGAVAMTAVLGGEPIAHLGYAFALIPVGLSCVSIVLIALTFNRLLKRNYPSPVLDGSARTTSDIRPEERVGIRSEDVRAALVDRHLQLNISEKDLEGLLFETEKKVYRRRFGGMRCEDIMSRDVITLDVGASAGAALSLMATHGLDSLPVVENGAFKGVLAASRLYELAGKPDMPLDEYLHSVAPVYPDRFIEDLMTPLAEAHGHRLPVVDADGQLIGMVSQTDLVAALFRTSLERPSA
ncbi:HPP family protein [Pseudomonas matsuisoli]|nr:HPP family protein [Pseudomonas matsuisoli]